jgi:hypothetical protein
VIDGGHMNNDFPGEEGDRWRILETEGLKSGLFEGMYGFNILKFNIPDV